VQQALQLLKKPTKKKVQGHAYEMLYLLSWCCRGAKFELRPGLCTYTIPDHVLIRARELTAELHGQVNMRYLNDDFTHKKNKRHS
jgi:hypothetical protein